MDDKDYIDIEIFPCAGGMGEGFRRAGIDFDLMIEIEETHCDSYEANLGHRPTTMDARSLLELLVMGWRPPKRVRLLVADPPCTPWSRAGKRMGQDDPRDMLEGTCRIISLLKPQAYLIGNVPGLDDGPNLPIVQRTIGALSKFGYCTADFARLDAANYGVPQHRIRPFWFGHLHGPCIQWPAPTHGDPAELNNLVLPGVDVLKPWVSCEQALGHLAPEDLGRPIKLKRVGTSQSSRVRDGSRPAAVVTAKPARSGTGEAGMLSLSPPAASKPKKRRDRSGDVPQADRVNTLDKPSATVTRNGGRDRMGAAATLAIGGTITVRDADHAMSRPHKPARTLTRNTHSDGAVIVMDAAPKLFLDLERTGEVAGDLEEAARDNAEIEAPPAFEGTVDELVQHLGSDEMFPPSQANDPARTVRAMGREMYLEGMDMGQYVMSEDERDYIVENRKHPVTESDAPAPTIRSGGSGHSAPQVVVVSPNHMASEPDEPSNTVKATSGGGSNRALKWPWPRPSTTIQRDERIAPPGHHDENWDGGLMSGGDAVVISERAAAILQGFPETWVFMGDSKKARWSQIGQAMPPPLAHAVASSVAQQMKRSDTQE